MIGFEKRSPIAYPFFLWHRNDKKRRPKQKNDSIHFGLCYEFVQIDKTSMLFFWVISNNARSYIPKPDRTSLG